MSLWVIKLKRVWTINKKLIFGLEWSFVTRKTKYIRITKNVFLSEGVVFGQLRLFFTQSFYPALRGIADIISYRPKVWIFYRLATGGIAKLIF